VEKCYKIHGYPTSSKQGGKLKNFRNANSVWTDVEKTEDTAISAAIPSLPGINSEQSKQFFQFLSQLTAGGNNK